MRITNKTTLVLFSVFDHGENFIDVHEPIACSLPEFFPEDEVVLGRYLRFPRFVIDEICGLFLSFSRDLIRNCGNRPESLNFNIGIIPEIEFKARGHQTKGSLCTQKDFFFERPLFEKCNCFIYAPARGKTVDVLIPIGLDDWGAYRIRKDFIVHVGWSDEQEE